MSPGWRCRRESCRRSRPWPRRASRSRRKPGPAAARSCSAAPPPCRPIWARLTWCCRCCTGPSARTGRSRGCWRWPGSSTRAPGCSPARAADLAQREAAIDEARRYDRKVLVEAAIDGAEIECAVLEGVNGGPAEASVPGQVIVDPDSTWYDFEAKYLAGNTRMEIPAPIPGPALEQVRALSCAAFDAISGEGLARVDCFYTSDGDVLVNEINTMPGMTPMSGFPMMWAASGLPVPALIDRIITTALAKPDGPR